MLDSDDEGSDDGENLNLNFASDREENDARDETTGGACSDKDEAPPAIDKEEATLTSDNEGEQELDDAAVDPRLKDNERTAGNIQRTVNRNGEARYWMVLARRWVADATPESGSGCAMYLPVFPQYVAALELIKRHRVLQELALTRGGERQYSDTCARLFHKHRRKARSQYNRSLCLALFTRDSPHCLAYNVLQGGDGPMKLSPKTAHLGTTDALMDLIASDQLYTDPAVFKIWVDAHASGLIYGATKQRQTARLENFLSVNYDAHARLEVSQRLKFQGFRHGSTHTYLAAQAQKFRMIRKFVRTDRIYNIEAVRKTLACLLASLILLACSILLACLLAS
jgi:hypothetical protein